jgi:acetyl-CoA acetyltransferase
MSTVEVLEDKVAIVGVGATPTGQHPGRSANELGMLAFKAALADAGIEKSQIDGVVGGALTSAGMQPEDLCRWAGLNPRIAEALVYCSSNIVIQHAARAIVSGRCSVVACIAARNPPGAGVALSGGGIYDAAHGLINANAVTALGWAHHMARHGTTTDHLGHVAVASRKWAQFNPDAEFRDPMTLDEYRAEPFYVWPFRSHDIAKSTAFGACIIVASKEIARDCAKRPVNVYATGRYQAGRLYENEDQLLAPGMRDCADQMYRAAGLKPSDIDAPFIYDAATSLVIQNLENFGFCEIGEGGEFVASGKLEPGGGFPLNTHGGHLSAGYSFGWHHHVALTRQLRGEAGEVQIPNARYAHFSAAGRVREDLAGAVFARG